MHNASGSQQRTPCRGVPPIEDRITAHTHTHTQAERTPERVSQEEVMAGSVTQKGATGHTSLCRPLPHFSSPMHARQGSRMRKLCPEGLQDAQGQTMTGFP